LEQVSQECENPTTKDATVVTAMFDQFSVCGHHQVTSCLHAPSTATHGETMSIDAYPLRWPDGWPRTAANQRESDRRFGGGRKLAMGRAVNQLANELRLLGAINIIVSSNIPTKSDGLPYAYDRRIDDPGVAVFFSFKKKHLVMARDGFTSVAGNIRSLTLAIEGLRQLERHGGSHMLEKAFTGFVAKPHRTGRSLGAKYSASKRIGRATSSSFTVRRLALAIRTLAVPTYSWPN
jgi:hypothetical protein